MIKQQASHTSKTLSIARLHKVRAKMQSSMRQQIETRPVYEDFEPTTSCRIREPGVNSLISLIYNRDLAYIFHP
jgi:hypothetical protein